MPLGDGVRQGLDAGQVEFGKSLDVTEQCGHASAVVFDFGLVDVEAAEARDGEDLVGREVVLRHAWKCSGASVVSGMLWLVTVGWIRLAAIRVRALAGRHLRNPVAACVLVAFVLADVMLVSSIPQHFPVALTCCPPLRPSVADAFVRRARVDRVDGEMVVLWESGVEPDRPDLVAQTRMEHIGTLSHASGRIQRVGFVAPWVEIIDHRLRWVEGPEVVLSDTELAAVRAGLAAMIESSSVRRGGSDPVPDLLRARSGRTGRPLLLGVVHDLVVFPLWLAAGYSVLTIPVWPVWQRLGVSSRARALSMERCPGCGYDIRGLVERRCPECGERWGAGETPEGQASLSTLEGLREPGHESGAGRDLDT